MEKITYLDTETEKIIIPKKNQLKKCLKPIHEARGIPNDYYINKSLLNWRVNIYLIKDGLQLVLLKIFPNLDRLSLLIILKILFY